MAKTFTSAGDGAANDSAAQTGNAPVPAGRSRELPLRAGDIKLSELIHLYMREYAGRDVTRVHRLGWWAARLGHLALQELSDDEVHAALQALGSQPNRYFAGRDVDRKPIYKARPRKPLAPATINRYAAALAAVITWAIQRRIAPRGFEHPCRTIERKPENNERVRFLSDPERERLLQACRASRWAKLYMLILMALTTGARKGELLALRWSDVDLARGVALCGRTKNGDSKALPLVPVVVELLRRFEAKSDALVFGSTRAPKKPYAFEGRWREALSAAKIRDFRFHDLRHSCASLLARDGATLLEIADVLGHRQMQMTRRYAHLTVHHKRALVTRVLGDIE